MEKRPDTFYKILNTKNPIYLILIILLLQFIIHFKYINNPPGGYHLWRQTQGLSIAKNFYEEGQNILFPKVDSRRDLSGITGMEFPFINYLTAIGYKTFGFHNWVHRTVILFFSFMAIIFCFLFFQELFNSQWHGIISAICLLFSPLFGYYSFTMMPGVPMLSFLLGTLFFFTRWQKKQETRYLLLALVFLVFSGLTKLSSFLIVPYIFYQVIKYSKNKKALLKNLLFFSFTIVIVFAWYLHARYISSVYCNFDIRLRPEFTSDFSIIIENILSVILQWLPGFYINYIQFIFFIFGLYYIFKNKTQIVNVFSVFYFGGLLFFMLMFLPMLKIHDYFMTVSIPLLILIVTVGIDYFHKISQRSKKYLAVFFLMMIVLPTAGTMRIIERFEDNKSSELVTVGQHLKSLIPDTKKLVIVGRDKSPSIYLYFFNRKGWSITEDIKPKDFEEMILRGAEYFISDSRIIENRKEIKPLLKLINSVNTFNIFQFNKGNITSSLYYNKNSFPEIRHTHPINLRNNFKIQLQKFDSKKKREKLKLFYQGLLMVNQKKYKKAIEFFKESLRSKPDYFMIYFQIGFCYTKLSQFGLASKFYLKSIDKNPNYDATYHNLYISASKNNSPGKLIPTFMKLNAKYSNSFYPKLYIAIIYGQIKKYNSSIDYYKQAIKLKPTKVLPHRNLSVIFHYLENNDESEKSLNSILSLKPDQFSCNFLRGVICYEQNKIVKAIRDFKKATKLKPDKFWPNLLLGMSYLKLKEYKKALNSLLKAEKINPYYQNYIINYCKGLIYLENNSINKALKEHKYLRNKNNGLACKLFHFIYLTRQNQINKEELVEKIREIVVMNNNFY